MRKPTPVFAALLVACATALAACAPTSPTTSPSYGHKCPGPTPGAPERTCSAAEYEMAQRRRAEFEKASQIYLDFTAERSRVAQAGGAEEPTQQMTRLADGEYLRMIMELLRAQRERGERREGEIRLLNIERIESRPDTAVALQACEDASQTVTVDGQGNRKQKGGFVSMRVFLAPVDGNLKIVQGTGEVVQSCGS